MEIKTNAVIVHSLTDIEIFPIRVTENNYIIIRKRLELEFKKIVIILNLLKDQGEIKTTIKPKNKKLQKHLNDLVNAKKIINNSIKNISEMYYK